MRRRGPAVAVAVLLLVSAPSLRAEEAAVLAPRVPAHRLAEARALTNPLPDSPETVERGKGLYHGKASCVNCHGVTGEGDGAFAQGLDPSPRDFRHRGFWRHRTDGEIFWVIKHGSAGTAMIGFGDVLSDDEVWAIVRYLHGFADEGGHRHDHGPAGRPEGGCCGRPDHRP